ncbi:hypothetical protein TWF192_008249 [Orbilia oligospora]|nr:hypothetical protein TWF192_008249 [Orbilia oligospora]
MAQNSSKYDGPGDAPSDIARRAPWQAEPPSVEFKTGRGVRVNDDRNANTGRLSCTDLFQTPSVESSTLRWSVVRMKRTDPMKKLRGIFCQKIQMACGGDGGTTMVGTN